MCSLGFKGAQCQVNVDDCHKLSCLNGGVCQDRVNRVQCSCAPGFTGSSCQVNIDECRSAPCRNGGRCEDAINNYKCHCPRAFAGKQCEFNASDPCAARPCRNGGACTMLTPKNSTKPFTCTCAQGFSGALCDLSTTHHKVVGQQLFNMSTVELLLMALLGVIVPILIVLVGLFAMTWRRHHRALQTQHDQFKSFLNNENNALRNIHSKLAIVDTCEDKVCSMGSRSGQQSMCTASSGCISTGRPILNNFTINKLSKQPSVNLEGKCFTLGNDRMKADDGDMTQIINAKVSHQMANLLTANNNNKMIEQEAHYFKKQLSTSALRMQPAMLPNRNAAKSLAGINLSQEDDSFVSSHACPDK